uniref:Mitogen-activated protein kinase 15 n=1 Tax=Tetraodon nigroviridis TaxID=99883 RepID=H3CUV4_TETNG
AKVSEVEEHISLKYEIKKRIGKGAYGIVWKAVDRQTGETVAVKKIFDAFRNRTDAQRTFREVMFLQEFGDHPNVVKLLNVIRAQNDKDIYLIFEYMDTGPARPVIKKGTLLKDVHKRYVMYQLLKAIKYLHSGNVIHRDQKVHRQSLSLTPERQQAPSRASELDIEISLSYQRVDIWSLGCILGEMLLGKALFPGTSTINQIEKIMSAIPHPSPEDILAIRSEYGSSVIQRMLLKPQVPLQDLLQPSVPPDALDLLRGLLVFNPDKRLTAEQALRHPYVARFHSPAKEPALDHDVVLPVDDAVQLSVVQYRNKLYEMMLERRTNQSMLKLIQPNHSSPGGKPSATDEEGKSSAAEDGFVRSPAGAARHWTSAAANSGLTEPQALPPPTGGATARGRSAPAPHNRAFSSALSQTQNNPLVRREETPLTSGVQVTPAQLNQRSNPQARAAVRYSKKVFQSNCNVAAAGDPAKLGSYTQAYGTINKSDLENLLRSQP